VALYWRKMDSWVEEDEEVFVHPRDPYKRIDVLQSSRHLEVRSPVELVAETRRPVLLFESHLPPATTSRSSTSASTSSSHPS